MSVAASPNLLQVSPLRDSAERRQLLRNRVGRVLLRPLPGRGEEPRRRHDGQQENRRRLVKAHSLLVSPTKNESILIPMPLFKAFSALMVHWLSTCYRTAGYREDLDGD